MPPQRAHWWQMHFLQVQQKTLSFSWWFSHLQSTTTIKQLQRKTSPECQHLRRKRHNDSWSSSSLVFVIVLMFGEAAELQGVQLLGDFFCPSTVNQLPQLQWSPEYQQQHVNATFSTVKTTNVLTVNWHSKDLSLTNSFSPGYTSKLTF